MAIHLTNNEQNIVKKFIDEIYRIDGPESGYIKSSTAIKFLMARKFDLNRAIDLYYKHQETRKEEGLLDINPFLDDNIQAEIYSGKFTVLPVKDENGCCIAIFTVSLHKPKECSHLTILRSLVFQLDCALENIETQKNGLVFIYDMNQAKYENFDLELSQKILSLLKGSYPAKLKKIFILDSPVWFSVSFKVLRFFLREKLRDRVYTVSKRELLTLLPHSVLPPRLGGTLKFEHSEWVVKCYNIYIDSSACVEKINIKNSHYDKKEIYLNEQNLANANTIWYDDDFNLDSTVPICDLNEESSYQLNNKVSIVDFDTHNKNNDNIYYNVNFNNGNEAIGGLKNIYLHNNASEGLSILEQLVECNEFGPDYYIKKYDQLKNREIENNIDAFKTSLSNNELKNRYTNIPCLDSTRVHLEGMPNDYIHANFVDGFMQHNYYLCTQGPLPTTLIDFWSMIWQCNVLIIVMVTRSFEGGNIKCNEYWPTIEKSEVKHGNFVIFNKSQQFLNAFITTNLVIQNEKTMEFRNINHLQFNDWPDFGVPQSADHFLEFIMHVRRLREVTCGELNKAKHPICVHCSAGVGRSGTFITMDINIDRLLATKKVDVHKTIERIRSQRALCIQSPQQYIFCYLALLRWANVNGGFLPKNHPTLNPVFKFSI